MWSTGGSGPLCVIGDLIVQSRAPVDLGNLERIEEIGGSLIVFDNPNLVEFPPFSNLRRIGGALSISENGAIAAIEPFPVLEDLSGALYIGENASLVAVDLGESLTSVGAVFVALNPKLETLGGLERVESVAGDFIVRDIDALATLDLPTLAEIDGTFQLAALPALRTAEFPALRRIGGAMSISSMGVLESLAGFPALDLVGGPMAIDDNVALTDLQISAPLTTLSSLIIRNNVGLERVVAAPTVALAPTTSITISDNPALEILDGFAGIPELAGLTLADNDALAQIAPWSGLGRVERLQIVRNAALTGLRAWLPALTSADDIRIFGNLSLEPGVVAELVSEVAHQGTPRVGDNMGETTVLDPCPWPRDAICDADVDRFGEPGTALCAVDPEDCEA